MAGTLDNLRVSYSICHHSSPSVILTVTQRARDVLRGGWIKPVVGGKRCAALIAAGACESRVVKVSDKI